MTRPTANSARTTATLPGKGTLGRASVRTSQPAQAESPYAEDHSGRWSFLFLMMFTAVLYARPTDYTPELRSFRLAELSALGAISFYVFARIRGHLTFVFPTQSKIILALTIIFAVGVSTAFWRFKALETLTDSWLKTLIIYFLLTQTVTSMRRIRMLIWVILLCMLFVSAYSVSKAQFMVDAQGRYIGATAGFLSGNYLGIAVASMFPFMSVFMAKTRSWVAVLALLATAAMLLWQIVLTASRGNFLQVGFSAILCWFLILQRFRRTKLIATVLSVSMVVFLAFAPSIFWGRIATLWGEEDANWMAVSAAQSESQRKNLLWRAVDYTLEDPLLGVGLGCFPIKSGTIEMRASEWLGTHNTFLQVSSEAGVPALILFIWLLLVSTTSMGKVIRLTKQDVNLEDLNLFAKAAMISLLTFAFAGFFAHLAYEFYLYYLIGVSVSVQTVYAKAKKKPSQEAVEAVPESASRILPGGVHSSGANRVPLTGRWLAGPQRTISGNGRNLK